MKVNNHEKDVTVEAAAAAIAAAAVGFLQRLQQVGAAAAAAWPASQQRQYFRPSIGSNISIYNHGMRERWSTYIRWPVLKV